jgi:hypothetical protein
MRVDDGPLVIRSALAPADSCPLTQLMHLQLRAVEKTGLERRLAKLERQLQVMLRVDRQPTHD